MITYALDEFFPKDAYASFSWDFGKEFHIRLACNRFFILRSGQYGGDNTVRETNQDHSMWLRSKNLEFSRCKGLRNIRDGIRSYVYPKDAEIVVYANEPLST